MEAKPSTRHFFQIDALCAYLSRDQAGKKDNVEIYQCFFCGVITLNPKPLVHLLDSGLGGAVWGSYISSPLDCFFGPRLCALLACLAAFLRRGLGPYISYPLRSVPYAAISLSCCGVPPLFSARPFAASFFSHSFFGPRLCALLASPRVPAFSFSSAQALAMNIFSFFGPCHCALLACPVVLLFCPRRGRFGRFSNLVLLLGPRLCCTFGLSCFFLWGRARLQHYWPVLLPSYFVLGVAFGRFSVFLIITPSLGRPSVRCWPVLLLSSFVLGVASLPVLLPLAASSGRASVR